MQNQSVPTEGQSSEQTTDLDGSLATTCSRYYYAFHNAEGAEIQLRGDLTMEDLVRMGYSDIRLVQPETQLKPHEWRCDFCGEKPLTDTERKYMDDHGDEIPLENANVEAPAHD